jgi:hypothetical protein
MKTAIRWTAIFLLPIMLVLVLGPAMHAAAQTVALHPALSLPIMGAGMLFPMGTPVDVATLERLRLAPAGGYEVYEDFLYDTQTYLAAGAANLQLAFFQANSADRTLTNLAQAGQLPAPHYFRAQRIFLSPQSEPSISAAQDTAGRVRDMDRILNTGRGILTFANSATNRTRGPIPIRAIGQLGGTRGLITSGVTAAGSFPIQQVQNDGGSGYPFDIVLKFGEPFSAVIQWGPVAQAISADLPLQLALYGWRYVKAS